MRSFAKRSEHSKAIAEADKKLQDIDRHRCQYTIDGMRCTEPGTICEGAVWSQNDRHPDRYWLCLTHYRLRGDYVGSREALHDLAAHPIKPPEDWRQKMLEDYQRRVIAARETLIDGARGML